VTANEIKHDAMTTANSRNGPLTIALPAALARKLEDESKKRGLEKSMLLMEAALGAVIDPPKIVNEEDSIQVSFRVPANLRQELARLARERETSISQLVQEALKRRIEAAPW